ncbi:MAG TPA: hypothetical protein VER39_03090 [Nocardioidaceae bacterium]|nr:hypothetical protein [Nocardioidaceae bacterium]
MPVHKPGVVALRPLRLGDFFDGAFATIRRNPTAMVGLAAVVTTVFLVVPVLLTLALAGTGHLSLDVSGDPAQGGLGALESGAVTALSYLGTVFGALATVVLNGLLVRVVAEAVLGRRTSAAAAWASTRGRLLRLCGLTALNLVVVLGLLGVPLALGIAAGLQVGVAQGLLVGVPLLLAGVAALAFVQVRCFQLAAPALVLERIGVVASLRRAAQLSRGQFWRLLGVQLLTVLVVGVVAQVIAVPLTLLGLAGPLFLPGTTGALVLVFAGYLSQVVVGAVTTPFTSAVVALQYVDQRIRKEGLDVQLIAAAQATPGGP